MQAIEQGPKFSQRGRRGQSWPNGEVGSLYRVSSPRWEPADGTVRQLAKNVLTVGEFRPP
jgi:hypothetical protein